MNIKKLLMSSLLMLGFVSASAQEPEVKTVYDFNPHWYVQIQPLGGQYTLGEVKFSDLLSYNVQAAIGYQFHHAVGARLSINAWQSKGGSEYRHLKNGLEQVYKWKWKYVAPMVDVTLNMSDIICGYNPMRVFNFSLLAGVGANFGFSNDEAADVQAQLNALYPSLTMNSGTYTYEANPQLSLLWDGTKTLFAGRFGCAADFRISDRVSAGLEFTANTLSDQYNSKPAGNADWYFNVNAGVKIALGNTYTTRTVTEQPRVIERVVEKVVEKPVYIEKKDDTKPVVDEKEPLRRDIFFTINSTTITDKENVKVQDVIDYMKKYPQAKVTITGYADKGTGNARINARLGQNRAKTVVDALVKAGIDASRITSDSKGDTVQPFAENDMNRVSICIAE